MRERRIMIELVVKDGVFEATATDYRLGAVRFKQIREGNLTRIFTDLRKAVLKQLKGP